MKFTEADKAKAENWWGNRNLVKELKYCGENIRDRRIITNVDLQFYAYIMRKAAAQLERKVQEMKKGLTKHNRLMFETVHCSHYLKKIKDGRHIFRIEKGMRQNSRTEWEYVWYEDSECKTKEVPPEDFGGSDFIKTYYERKEKDFTGIVVGFELVTTKAELFVDVSDDQYGYYEWVAKSLKEQVKCAKVYYGCNRSRMVPLDCITVLACDIKGRREK